MARRERKKPSGAKRSRPPAPPIQDPRARKVGVSDDPEVFEPQSRGSFPIVGVGASAGGLEAFSAMLRALPVDTHMAFVLIQHLAPKHESLLTELLSKSTSMPIEEVADGTTVEPNHVYVIPPDANMGIMHGVLHLVPRATPARADQNMPIDYFLRTLAEDQKNNAIGVILSGTASDGALGLRMIKGEGGITIAQDPKEAKYDGMPRAAIAAGAVDLVLSIDHIAAELTKIGRHPYVSASPGRSDAGQESEDHLKRIFFLLKQSSGVDFTYYKHATIKRRLQRRMVLNKVQSLKDYVKYLNFASVEVDALYQDLLIHVTGFFREPDAFEALRSVVFPQLLTNRPANTPIRIWVPGCSTGEEAYSIAIALLEFLDQGNQDATQVQIFASDVSQNAIDKARAGFYPDNIKADVSPDRLRRFFTPIDGGYRVSKAIRDLCVFARQDLTKDPPFSQIDLISCRNVLIYLGSILQKRAMTIFHYALRPIGFLLLGASETIGSYADLFGIADKKHKIYLKKSTAVRPYLGFAMDYGNETAPSKATFSSRARPDFKADIDRLLLDRCTPAAVLINSDLQIIQVRGSTGRFLEPSTGEATLNILKLARPGLMIELRTAIHATRKTGHAVSKQGIRVKQNGHFGLVDLEVVPIDSSSGEKLWIVLFKDGAVERAGAAANPGPADKGRKAKQGASKKPQRGATRRVNELEQELTATREYLHSIIHDQEATNEELQSANEEILSSNEELQSTNEELETAKEELQSTNEELNTVNDELQTRNHELSHLNNDLTNLLASVHIPIIMIGNDLRIRRFTPMAANLFNLIASDVGRPITDIKPKVEIPNFEQLISEAIDTMTLRELEIQHPDGRSYSMRLRPYKTADNRIEGCVVALVDLPFQRRTDGGIPSSFSQRPMFIVNQALRIQAANSRFCEEYGVSLREIQERRLEEVLDGRLATAEMGALLQRVANEDVQLDDLAAVHEIADGPRKRLGISACRLPGRDGSILVAIESSPQPPGGGGRSPDNHPAGGHS